MYLVSLVRKTKYDDQNALEVLYLCHIYLNNDFRMSL